MSRRTGQAMAYGAVFAALLPAKTHAIEIDWFYVVFWRTLRNEQLLYVGSSCAHCMNIQGGGVMFNPSK
jgi:hypothetical protein